MGTEYCYAGDFPLITKLLYLVAISGDTIDPLGHGAPKHQLPLHAKAGYGKMRTAPHLCPSHTAPTD